MISFWLQVFSPVCATSCLPVDAGCILMASLVNRLSNCTPRTDNPGHTINTMLHVMQCSGKVQHNAIKARHTTIYNAMEADTQLGHTINTILHVMQQGGIYNALQVDTQLGHTINTAGGDCSLPTIGGSSPGHSKPLGSKCLMPQNINRVPPISTLVSTFYRVYQSSCHLQQIVPGISFVHIWTFLDHWSYFGPLRVIRTILGYFGPYRPFWDILAPNNR